ncbi:cadherin repeat domain-containing protein [Candidatus Woesearchaeota archaeon]|nr:cadherin repeat domain-containing protein [Candidatus Woesearchaeota archaeon]
MAEQSQMPPKKRGERRKEGEKALLPTNNLFALIIIILIVASSLSSYLTYSQSRRVADELSGKAAAEAQLCINKQPSISQNCSTNATIGAGYYCNVDAVDPDNDTITFYDDTSLFDIDQTTGEIIFTPVSGDEGTHTVTVTASDGAGCLNSNATTTFTITIPAPPGPPPGPGGGGGGGGGGGAVEAAPCTPIWECTPWGFCGPDGTRTRICYSLNNCFTGKPDEKGDCIYVLPPAPRKPTPIPEFYLCNFDEVDECSADFGVGENWVYTYKYENSTFKAYGITGAGMDASIDETIFFFAPMTKIQPLDVTGDNVPEFEYILHTIVAGKARTTVRLVKQYQSVVERPVYIETLPYVLIIILMFVYDNACLIFLIVLLLLAILIYFLLMRRFEKEREMKEQKT